MSSSNRRSLISSSAAAAASKAMAKRPAAAADNYAKISAAAALQRTKKRVALGNLSNQSSSGLGRKPDRPVTKADNVNAVSSISKVKKGQVTTPHAVCLPQNSVTTTFIVGLHQTSTTTTAFNLKPTIVTSSKGPSFKGNDRPTPTVASYHAPCSTIIASPNRSEDSVSLDETMSTCDSMESPKFEYIDNIDSSAVVSLERQASNTLHISHDEDSTGCTWKKNVPHEIEASGQIIDVDDDESDPQLCAVLASDIYKHLRMAETKKRPSTDFMERVQKDVNESMRAILIDWLVEVTEEYRLVPDTLYLTVNYIDRYLSGNEINRQRLQLLGVACMMIAAKYEEICAPQVEEFCYITDNTYFKDEVLQMETDVLNYLKFEMTAPTAKCFLRRFVRVAQGCDEAPQLQLEFLANYVAELSLLEYDMLRYPPSLIAAASVFLARFILQPTKQPWNRTLSHYTLYKPSELCNCTKAIHQLVRNSPSGSLPAIREKYSQHKYKFVAKKNCPSLIPSVFFEDSNS